MNDPNTNLRKMAKSRLRSSLRTWSIWLLKGNAIVWAINTVLLVVLFSSGYTLTELIAGAYLSKITLLETGIAFLVGGALAFSGSASSTEVSERLRKSNERWSLERLRKSEKRANRYIVLAMLFFFESLIISLLGA
jgi:hypothetical protein